MSKRSDAFMAFLAGAAVGAAVGILFAPDKGKNTRERLGIHLEKYKDKLKDIIAKYATVETVENNSNGNGEVFSAAKNESIKVVKDARAQAEALLEDVEDLISQISKGKTA
ncbi:MAG: YtxH domain-containing protein [Bacteroidota bacterium]|nr:YtxH domain-containing protein [Bacteroidota bacterium]